MANEFKGKWTSRFLPRRAGAKWKDDGVINIMEIDEKTGDIRNCTHGTHKVEGYVRGKNLHLENKNGSNPRYDGELIYKNGQVMIVVGKVYFGRQEEGTWVATKP